MAQNIRTEKLKLNYRNIRRENLWIFNEEENYAILFRQEQWFSHPNIWRNVAE